MKKLLLFLLLFLSLKIASEDLSSIIEDSNLQGIWLLADEYEYDLQLERFSWGNDLFEYYSSVIIDQGFFEQNGNSDEWIFRFCGSQAYIRDLENPFPNIIILHLIDVEGVSSVVVVNLVNENELWVETIEDFSERKEFLDYSEYLRTDVDINYSIQFQRDNFGYRRFYRHPIDLHSGPVYATTKNSSIRLRSEPNLQGPGMGFLQQGQEVQVLEISDHMEEIGDNVDNWYRVRTSDGTEAWTYGAFMDFPESAYVWYEEDGAK